MVLLSSHFRKGLLPGGSSEFSREGRGVKDVDEDANEDENNEGNKREKWTRTCDEE